MKGQTGGIVIKEFAKLKPNIYSFQVDNCSEHEKSKYTNKTFLQK